MFGCSPGGPVAGGEVSLLRQTGPTGAQWVKGDESVKVQAVSGGPR